MLPPIALAVGWIGWDWKVGAIAALVTFATAMSPAAGLALLIREPSWMGVLAPFLAGCLYGFLPDFIPIPIDDAAAVAAGACVSLLLAWRVTVRSLNPPSPSDGRGWSEWMASGTKSQMHSLPFVRTNPMHFAVHLASADAAFSPLQPDRTDVARALALKGTA